MTRVEPFTMRRGERLLIGAPGQFRINPEATNAIALAASQTAGVIEAHLPQVQAPSLGDKPVQVLVLVLKSGSSAAAVLDVLGPRLGAIVPQGVHLDVWPLPSGHPLLTQIRGAGCALFTQA
jgi:hypothetical protein